MNSKDREALDKFIDEAVEEQRLFAAMSDEERVNFITEKFFEAGFLAGARHAQEVLDRADLIQTNREDVLPAAQEAAHYNWLDDKIREVEHHNMNLQIEVDKLRQALKFTTKAAVHLFQPDKPLEKGLPPFFYHTTTYEGDLELIENTKLAMELLKENNE